ncbi:MAG: hypothetical protein Q4C81_04120 [Kocuria sp.]|nr:hypothetical protein [Kocuria sp.]
MQTIVVVLLIGIGLAWFAWLALRRLAQERALTILDLEARHHHACEIGDVAGADQIEAALRDIPESGWSSGRRGPGRQDQPGLPEDRQED